MMKIILNRGSALCAILLLVAFAFNVNAQVLASDANDPLAKYNEQASNPTNNPGAVSKKCNPACKMGEVCTPKNLVEQNVSYYCKSTAPTDDKKPPVAGGSSGGGNTSLDSCNASGGLFGGLLATGSKIFKGLRDLIYVVAGFGIIGVAVGGFFGNLNWKWLGSIIISLIIIASTGELINMIVGCDGFTSEMIQDTLKE